jgi:DNA replication factor GINS
MYNVLYEAWKRELESVALEKLSSDFYSRTAEYMKKLREESRMLDKRTMKASLVQGEMQNARRMIRELIHARCLKIVGKVSKEEKIASDYLTMEEEILYEGMLPLGESFQDLAKALVQGRGPMVNAGKRHRNAVLRFSKDVPEIMGADMKTYGPFKVEDVASLPAENAKLLAKQGLAEKIEV